MAVRVGRCLAIVNQLAGRGNGRDVYDKAVRQAFDHSGVLHYAVDMTDANATCHALKEFLPRADALVVCGGDGTINYIATLLLCIAADELSDKPILIVPAGCNNSLALSLGIRKPESALQCLSAGNIRRVPIWQVQDPKLGSLYMLSHLALGTLASVAQRWAQYEEMRRDYCFIPSFTSTLGVACMASVMQQDTISCSATVYTSSSTPAPHLAAMSPHVFAAPLRMLVASQVPRQMPRLSLTPDVIDSHKGCAVTVVTGAASRLRMWHLLRREARRRRVLNEDGVTSLLNVVRIELHSCKKSDDSALASHGNGEEEEDEDGAAYNLLVDGNVVPCNALDGLVLECSGHSLPFFTAC